MEQNQLYLIKQLEKQIGSRHDGERYTSRYYIKSIKVEK